MPATSVGIHSCVLLSAASNLHYRHKPYSGGSFFGTYFDFFSLHMGKNKKNNKPLSEVIGNVVTQLGSNTEKSYTIFTHIQLTFENLKLHIKKHLCKRF